MNYSVCMTVYGKSPYLYDQLVSILNQSIPPSQIIIVEDYSGLSVKNYLEKILIDKKIPYKILINNVNLGPAESFRKAILSSDYDIIYFSDHDDIWDKNRVANTIDYHKKNFLVICNAKVFYENNKMTYSLYKKKDFNNLSTYKLFYKNLIVGATTSVNIKNYRQIIKKIKFEPMHDWALAIMSTILNKKIKFVDSELIFYRRHEQTLTNRFKNSILKKINFRLKIIKFIFNLKKLLGKNIIR